MKRVRWVYPSLFLCVALFSGACNSSSGENRLNPDASETGNHLVISDPELTMDGYGNGMVVYTASEPQEVLFGGRTIRMDRVDVGAIYYKASDQWEGTSTLVSQAQTDFNPSREGRIAMSTGLYANSDNGTAIALWEQGLRQSRGDAEEGDVIDDEIDQTRDGVYARHYSKDSGWSDDYPLIAPCDFALVCGNTSYTPRTVELDMNQTGTALAVVNFSQVDSFHGGSSRLYAYRYVPGTGWSGPDQFTNEASNSAQPRVAMLSTGQAHVVWRSVDNDIMARFCASPSNDVACQWQDIRTLHDGITIDNLTGLIGSREPRLATSLVDETPMVIWLDGGDNSFHSVRFENGDWDALPALGVDLGYTVQDYHVGVRGTGETMLVWAEVRDGIARIRSRRYLPASNSWEAPVLVAEQGLTGVTGMGFSMSNTGKAALAWVNRDNGRLFGSVYDFNSNSWENPIELAPGAVNVHSPRVAVDLHTDTALAVWVEDQSATNPNQRIRRHVFGQAVALPSIPGLADCRMTRECGSDSDCEEDEICALSTVNQNSVGYMACIPRAVNVACGGPTALNDCRQACHGRLSDSCPTEERQQICSNLYCADGTCR